MITPYDWQEGMGHRAEFVEARLKAGAPVIAVSIPDGILLATYRGQASKLHEIYDRIAYSAIGMQSDVEAIRVAAVEFCHQEGFRRSEDDVTLQRLATRMSEPVKRAFGDFRSAPIVVRSLFAEVGSTLEEDLYYMLDFDGDYAVRRGMSILAGSKEAFDAMREAIQDVDFTKILRVDAEAQLREALIKGMDPEGDQAVKGEMPELFFESAILRRDHQTTRKFLRLSHLTI